MSSGERFVQLDHLTKVIGMNMRRLRQGNSLSLEKFSDELGIPEKDLDNFEKGFVRPDIPTLVKIAHYFNLSPLDFEVDPGIALNPANDNGMLLEEK